MSEELMSIRAMCEAFDVTPRTLRFYEQKELLSPIREGQKRLFTRRDRVRLKLILRGKRFGVSLEEIRKILDVYDMGRKQDVQLEMSMDTARRRLREMIEQRAELDQTINDLQTLIAENEAALEQLKRNTAA